MARIKGPLRAELLAEMNGRCGYCGTEIVLSAMQVDHKLAIRRGGTDDRDNLLAACRRCNNLKNTFTDEQFRHEIQQQVSRARRCSVNFRTAERYGLIKVIDVPVYFYYETLAAYAEREG